MINFLAINIKADHLTAIESEEINLKIVNIRPTIYTANKVTAVNLTASTVT